MSPETIGKLVQTGVYLLVSLYGFLIATGTVRLHKDPDVAEEKRNKLGWIFWILGVGGIGMAVMQLFR